MTAEKDVAFIKEYLLGNNKVINNGRKAINRHSERELTTYINLAE